MAAGMAKKASAVLVMVGALAIGGCGGGSSSAAGEPSPALKANTPVVSRPVIENEAGLQRSGYGWVGPGGCRVILILNTPQEIQTYTGDSWVITDPTHQIGVKLQEPDLRCIHITERALLGVELDGQPKE
jgi:hypothetical protein